MGLSTKQGTHSLLERFEGLCRAGIQIHSAHQLEPVLQTVVDVARDVIGANYAAISVLDRTRTGMAQFLTSGITESERARIGHQPEGKGVLGLLITNPEPIRIPDICTHSASAGFPEHHPQMHSFLGVPIRGRAGPIGNLYLADKQGASEFSPEDETVAVMLASQAAVAIENARLYESSIHLVEELRAMQQTRDRLAAMINHELRNALTGVYGWAELLLRKLGDDSPRAAREVFESAQETLELLNDLLDLSRMEADKLQIKIQSADARELMREALRTVEPAAEARGLSMTIVGADRSHACHTDPRRVRQILINLLSNGIRHSPEGGDLSMELHVTEERLRFDVVDHGDGIPPEERESIFEAFHRASARSGGTGLGLTLSRGLARLLGGDLRVQSRVGEGSRFTLELPRRARPA